MITHLSFYLNFLKVIVDDCWMSTSRDADGKLQADPDRFPDGMKALGDYVFSHFYI